MCIIMFRLLAFLQDPWANFKWDGWLELHQNQFYFTLKLLHIFHLCLANSGLNQSKTKDLQNANIQYPCVCFHGYIYSKQHMNDKNTLFAELNNIPQWYELVLLLLWIHNRLLAKKSCLKHICSHILAVK